ncbi:MAG: hypothetical protein PVI91_17925, partial [Gammaproteobacteria bacterium]
FPLPLDAHLYFLGIVVFFHPGCPYDNSKRQEYRTPCRPNNTDWALQQPVIPSQMLTRAWAARFAAGLPGLDLPITGEHRQATPVKPDRQSLSPASDAASGSGCSRLSR